MYVDLARQASLRKTTKIVPRNEERGSKPSSIERRLTKGYTILFINSANSSSPFGFPPDDKVLHSSVSARFLVICATAAAQVGLNAWNRPFYEAISARNFLGFVHQLLVFAAIAGGLLVLNVAQAWFREMIKLRSREWLTRDLFAKWLKPSAPSRLAGAGEIGVNPDQRIHEDARRLTELSADLGVGLLQASALLLSFLGVLWTVSGAFEFSICGLSLAIPGYIVWCALLYAASGSWLTWRVGRPLVSINSRRYHRESELRFALFQANQHMQRLGGEEREKPDSVSVSRRSS